MIKNIWLVNKYAMPPQYESRLRTIEFAHYLQEMGYKVTIFGSSVMHNMNLDLIDGKERFIPKKYDDLNFVHIKSCQYTKNSSLKRVWSDVQFHYRLVRLAKQFDKPDLVIATTSPIFTNPILKYCKRNGIKYITESLDWWPDVFVDFGLLKQNNPITRLLFWQAKSNYVHSDAVVVSAKGCHEYIKDKKWDKEQGGPVDLSKVYYINNGVDLMNFDTWKEQYQMDDADLLSSKKKIIYLGSIRLANNVDQLVKAAELLCIKPSVEFLIYGDGEDREPLKKYCHEHNLKNVKFKEKWIDPKFVPYVLSKSYLNILNYAPKFGRYGISSSKMFQYMASGRPIVCNIDIMYCPITENNIGIAHEMKNAHDYAAAIDSILELSEDDYCAMCERARKTAREYDYPYLAKQMADVINSI